MKNKEPKTNAGTIGIFVEKFVVNNDFNRGITKNFAQAESLRHIVDYEAFNDVTEEITMKKKKDCKKFLMETNRIFGKI